MSGRLFVVATPVGNLGDLSKRVADVLNLCQYVLVEDTRVSVKLLHHLGVKKKLISCHEFNETARQKLLEEAVAEGADVAILSDAGTPLVSDPGFQIVQKAISLNMPVIPVPGPSAFLLALTGSGLPCDRFVFEGFLPDKQGQMIRRLEELKDERRTMVFYVSPHSVVKTVSAMFDVFGERPACIARELTKLHEEFIRSPLSELVKVTEERALIGEMVIVIGGNDRVRQEEPCPEQEVRRLVALALQSGQRAKEISKNLSELTGWKKSQIYEIAVQEQQKSSDAG